MSPSEYRSTAIEQADERQDKEVKDAKIAREKAFDKEAHDDMEKFNKGYEAADRDIPQSAKATKEFTMPKFIEDRDP